MIDTDKYGMTNEKLLDTYSNLSVDGYKDLLAEVLRLREVAYLRICLIGERDKEIGRLREGIEQAVKLLNTDANATKKLLKELIE
tara:strand:- start:9919 stop:10173 length:255 start_codon:yes stop_codon:yes gene_type:complete